MSAQTRTCPDCDGLGRWPFRLGGDDCLRCYGTGVVPLVVAAPPPPVHPDTARLAAVRAFIAGQTRHNCALVRELKRMLE